MPLPVSSYYSTPVASLTGKSDGAAVPATPEIGKKVKSKRLKSRARSGQFQRDLLAFLRSPDAPPWAASLVGSRSPTHPRKLLPFVINEEGKKRKPPRWTEALDEIKLLMGFMAMKLAGPTWEMTVNLGTAFEQVVRAQPDVLDYVRRRIAHHLNTALGRQVDFMFALEETRGRLHLHGMLAITDNEEHAACQALRKAGGKWCNKRGGKYQVLLRPEPDMRGAGYAGKELIKAWYGENSFVRLADRGRTLHRKSTSFGRKAFTMTNPLRAKAKSLHADLCKSTLTYSREKPPTAAPFLARSIVSEMPSV